MEDCTGRSVSTHVTAHLEERKKRKKRTKKKAHLARAPCSKSADSENVLRLLAVRYQRFLSTVGRSAEWRGAWNAHEKAKEGVATVAGRTSSEEGRASRVEFRRVRDGQASRPYGDRSVEKASRREGAGSSGEGEAARGECRPRKSSQIVSCERLREPGCLKRVRAGRRTAGVLNATPRTQRAGRLRRSRRS